MTEEYEEQIAKLTELLKMQQKLYETAVDMLKPTADAAYQKGYADAMGWKTQNHLEHLTPQRKEWVGLTYEEQETLVEISHSIRDAINRTDWKLKEKNND